MDAYARTELLIGRPALQKLEKARVAVFGVGGVGSYAVEALVRTGVGSFDLFDPDDVHTTNLNRQIIATQATIGRKKVEVERERILSINPKAAVATYPVFYLPENADDFDFSGYSYVVDAVDTVSAKLEIVCRAYRAGVPVISSMGAGNKLDPTRFQVADLYSTTVCPLAKTMRRELRKRGVPSLKVVYSTEDPIKPVQAHEGRGDGRRVPGSIAFVPSVAGLVIASEVVRDLIR